MVGFSGLRGHMKRVLPKVHLPRGGYFNKEPGYSCKYYFLFSKFETIGIDNDYLIQISKKIRTSAQ